MPLSTIGRLVCFASQGKVFFQVRFGEVLANSNLPISPSLGLLADPDSTAEVTGRPEELFFDLTSSSLLPGTGASNIKTTNLIWGILLTQEQYVLTFLAFELRIELPCKHLSRLDVGRYLFGRQ